MPRNLEQEQAIEYIDDIRATFEKTEEQEEVDEEGPLNTVITLVTLQRAQLIHAQGDRAAVARVPFARTGFPSLPTLLADAESTLKEYESVRVATSQALLDLLGDLKAFDSDSLKENAANRAQRIIFSSDFIEAVELTTIKDQAEAFKTITYWRNLKEVPGFFVAVSEVKGLLMTETGRDNRSGPTKRGYKFIPIMPHAPQDKRGESFFLVYPWRYGSSDRPHIFPKFGQVREGERYKTSVDLNRAIRTTRHGKYGYGYGEKFYKLLSLYDAVAYPSQNRVILETIANVIVTTGRLKDTIKTLTSDRGKIDMEELKVQQLGWATTVEQVSDLPEDISELIQATIKDILEKEIKKLAPPPPEPLERPEKPTGVYKLFRRFQRNR